MWNLDRPQYTFWNMCTINQQLKSENNLFPGLEITEPLLCTSVSMSLKKKNPHKFDDYVADMALNTQPFDEVALFLCARMFGHHYTVFFHDMWINTHSSFENTTSKVYLLFCGDMKFDLLIPHDTLPSNDDEPESSFEADPNDVEMACMKLASKAEEEAQRKKDKVLNQLLQSTVVDKQGKIVPNVKPKKPITLSSRSGKGKGKGHSKTSAASEKTEKNPPQPLPLRSASPARTRLQSSKGTAGRTTHMSLDAGRVEFLKMSDKNAPELDVYGMPKNKANSSTKNIVPKRRNPSHTSLPSKSAKGAKVAVKTAKGKVLVTCHAIPKSKPPTRSIRCPWPKCKQQFPSQKDVNKHLQEKHPTYRFPCKYCNNSYQTANACYKYEK